LGDVSGPDHNAKAQLKAVLFKISLDIWMQSTIYKVMLAILITFQPYWALYIHYYK